MGSQWSDRFPWYIKQPIDQAAHFAATFAGVWVVGLLLFQFIGHLGAVLIGAFGTFSLAFTREVAQYINRKKPKYLDTFVDLVFFAGGVALGVWSFWEVVR